MYFASTVKNEERVVKCSNENSSVVSFEMFFLYTYQNLQLKQKLGKYLFLKIRILYFPNIYPILSNCFGQFEYIRLHLY